MFKNINKRVAKLLVFVMIMITILSSISTTTFASQNTYYVATTGSDSNSGSIGNPFKTIQKGVSILTAGDTLLIRAGTYKEKVSIKNSGSSAGYITIKNYAGEKVIIKGTNTGGGNISIVNKSYIRIEGLEICDNSGNNTPMGISVEGAGTNIQIVNNKVYGITSSSNAHGIAVYGTNSKSPITNLLIEGNEVYNCKLGQSESMVLNGNVTEFKVINNKVHDNDNIGIDFIGYEGTAGSGETDRVRDGICSGNMVYNISSIKNPTYNDYAADGIYVDGGKNIIIEGNYVRNCDIGIEMASEHKGKTTDNIIVRNNLILDCTNYAALVFGGESKSNGNATNIKIYNNTVYNADTALVIANADSSTNEVKNNIFNKVNTIIEGNVGKNTIENNMSSDAQFVSPSSGNFELKAGSPCINAGISVNAGNLDYSLKTRIYNGKIDMGCLEYGSNNNEGPQKPPTNGGGDTQTPPVLKKYTLKLTGYHIKSVPGVGQLDKNTSVKVVVTPSEGKRVSTFTVDGIEKKNELKSNSYTFALTKDTEVVVKYEKISDKQYNLKLTGYHIKSEPGIGQLDKNTSVKVVVTPSEGKKVSTFKVDGVEKKNELKSNSYTFALTKDTEVVVKYEKISDKYSSNNTKNGNKYKQG